MYSSYCNRCIFCIQYSALVLFINAKYSLFYFFIQIKHLMFGFFYIFIELIQKIHLIKYLILNLDL